IGRDAKKPAKTIVGATQDVGAKKEERRKVAATQEMHDSEEKPRKDVTQKPGKV
ncbi:hypothetical protein GCK32_009428, partial [Trichostrongylus colubriformis]